MKNHTTAKGRPLSFPSAFESLPSVGPSSPLETTCCRCRRTKSATTIFPVRQTSPKRSGRGVLSKLSWSVFKSKQTERSLHASSSQNLHKDSKPTSWKFHPWASGMNDRIPTTSTAVGASEGNGNFLPSPPKQVFVMTPMNQRNTSSNGSSNSLLPDYQSSSERKTGSQQCLRKYVLNRDMGTQTPPGSIKRKHVPRSPGPLDGSLYTQVKKNRRVGTDETDGNHERTRLSSRDYHSADELSATATLPMQPEMERKSFSGSSIKDEVKEELMTNPDALDQVLSDPTEPLFPPVTSPDSRSVDLLRDVTITSVTVTAEVMQDREEVSDDDQVVVETVDGVVVDLPTDITQDVVDSVSGKDAICEDSELQVTPPPSNQPSHVKTQEYTEVLTVGDEKFKELTEDSNTVTDSQDQQEEEEEEDMEHLLPSPENHLTQVDVDNVMALVNECLEDSAAHSINQAPAFNVKHGSGFAEVTDMGPTFSPQQPDYPAMETDVRFEEKGPEYALPVRDVVLTSIPARKAVLVTSQTDVNNSNNATLMESGGYSTIDDLQTEQPQRPGHKNSLDSGHSVGSAVTANHQITLSNSDVDSGIEGSATVISTSSDVRPSPTLDRSTVASTRVTSSHSDVTHDGLLVRVREVSQVVEQRSECVGTENYFNETSATQCPEQVVEYIPAPKEAEIKIITVKNVYAGIESQKLATSSSNPEPPTVTEVAPTPPPTPQAPITDPAEDEDALEEEERQMQEEIENTRKKLLWLEEKRIKMKKKKDAAKRHSFTPTTPIVVEAAPKHVVSSTLPRRPPTHVTPLSNQSKPQEVFGSGGMSAKERQDIDELLRSVQELDFTIPQLTKAQPQEPQSVDMATTAMPPEHHPHFHETSPGFNVPDARVAKRAVVFTPAYAHPMHQPQHIPTQQQQMKMQEDKHKEEVRRRRLAEDDIIRRQMEQEKLLYKRRERDFLEQEEKRKMEREEQDKFQVEFENKQKLLRKESGLPPREIPLASQLQQQKKRLTSSRSSPLSSVTSPISPLPSVTSPPPQETRPAAQDAKPDVAPDLQSQLDELDRYIAQLSSVADIPAEPAASPPKSEVLRRRRSFSVELERRIDPGVKLTTEEMSSPISTALVPPRPPSRTRSSFDSVSRRLSHGFELAQVMRQTSIEKESQVPAAKDDDVFDAPQPAPQPSYPPKTSLTRPAQQQIIVRPVVTPPPAHAQSKSPGMEDRLSPELFLAMSINPGGRPVENIHSYKEDLVPEISPKDVVDGPPATPGFPTVPPTPYVNDSPLPGHVPVGLAKTPLAALGLKPKDHPQPSIDETPCTSHQNQVREQLNGAPKQQEMSPVTSSHGFANGYVKATVASPNVTSPLANIPTSRLEEQVRQRQNAAVITSTQVHGHGVLATGVAEDYPEHFKQVPQNGWNHQGSYNPQFQGQINGTPWVHNGENPSPIATTPTTRSPVVSSLGHSLTPPAFGSGGVSPSGTRSLTGSNDSLLSDGSASGRHSHHAYQQQQRYGNSHPPLPPKESSRHSGSSVRSTSTAGSGYLGGASQTSPHSAGSPVSTSAPYMFSHTNNKRESQMSSYDRQVPHGHALSSDDGGLSSPASVRTSSSSISDVEKLAHEMAHAGLNGNSPPKFIKDTTSYWYKKDITREQALAMLRTMPAGSFVVRDSRCYPGAFGLALKVHEVPQAVVAAAKPGTDMNDELVRHFLIEPSSRGVKLKGCANEPVFGSLSALIYQHSITPLALPCKLIIPSENMEIRSRPGSVQSSQEISNSAAELLKQGAACNVLYLGSADTESLTGPEAIERAMREVTQSVGQAVKTSVVHFKVSAQGITLTDNARKIFFRRHYPTGTLTYCGIDPSSRDPHNRRWDATIHRGPSNARVFGFVAKKTGTAENSCHLFAELDMDQPAPAIVNFINKILLSGASHS